MVVGGRAGWCVGGWEAGWVNECMQCVCRQECECDFACT